jgi:hypothetical protein
MRYYGYYSNKARGQRRRQNLPAPVACAIPNTDEAADDCYRRFCRHVWARLIRKVYLADPFICPKCGGSLCIISFIDNPAVIERILKYLKLWDLPEHPPAPTVVMGMVRLRSPPALPAYFMPIAILDNGKSIFLTCSAGEFRQFSDQSYAILIPQEKSKLPSEPIGLWRKICVLMRGIRRMISATATSIYQ